MSRNLAQELSSYPTGHRFAGLFDIQPLPGEAEVLRVTVRDKEELPVFISQTDEQILCLVYLATQEEIRPERMADMHEAMLSSNVAMPLSAFAKIENRYVLYGALAVSSSADDLAHELTVLADNAVEALSALSTFIR